MASETEARIASIQKALQEEKIDGWLFYNFRESNYFASRILRLPSHLTQTRRYYYFIPAKGNPAKLVHGIEEWNLDHLPGSKTVYVSWQSLEAGLRSILTGVKKIAMEYSPRNAIPYVAKVDAGTIEFVKSFGVEVVTSADLIQHFEATWDEEQTSDNFDTARHLREIVDVAFGFIKQRIQSNQPLTEYDVQQTMKTEFSKRGLISDSDPNCSVNANSANPHYEPTSKIFSSIKKGDLVLIDLWAKTNKARSVYADITWMGYIGTEVPSEYVKIFSVIRDARDAALNLVKNAYKKKVPVYGYQVDDAARKVITDAGCGNFFIHRTGHSIGEEVHGNSAHMDNLETHDERRVLPSTSFSVEPGVYFKGKFGMRTEIDVFISPVGEVIVTGLPSQTEIVPILK
jgi:Xaa-Pro aminopeptidase